MVSHRRVRYAMQDEVLECLVLQPWTVHICAVCIMLFLNLSAVAMEAKLQLQLESPLSKLHSIARHYVEPAQGKVALVTGDTTHFDLSYEAFTQIARWQAGVIDVNYVRVPAARCRTPVQQVNADTCNDYYGVLVSKDLWKLFVGIAVCMAMAAIIAVILIKSVYGLRTPQPFAPGTA